MATLPDCYKCEFRTELISKYGNCHNEHCPKGWSVYEALQKEDYDRRKMLCDIAVATYTMTKELISKEHLRKKGK